MKIFPVRLAGGYDKHVYIYIYVQLQRNALLIIDELYLIWLNTQNFDDDDNCLSLGHIRVLKKERGEVKGEYRGVCG